MKMDHVVDIGYNLEPVEMFEWCHEHLNGPFDTDMAGGWIGPNWLVCHTTTDFEPYHIVTRGRFASREDAMLFKLRWS